MNIRCLLPTRFLEILFNKKIGWLILLKQSDVLKDAANPFKCPGQTFQTLIRAFETLRENQKLCQQFEKLTRVFEKLFRESVEKARSRVSVTTFPMLSQLGTVLMQG